MPPAQGGVCEIIHRAEWWNLSHYQVEETAAGVLDRKLINSITFQGCGNLNSKLGRCFRWYNVATDCFSLPVTSYVKSVIPYGVCFLVLHLSSKRQGSHQFMLRWTLHSIRVIYGICSPWSLCRHASKRFLCSEEVSHCTEPHRPESNLDLWYTEEKIDFLPGSSLSRRTTRRHLLDPSSSKDIQLTIM